MYRLLLRFGAALTASICATGAFAQRQPSCTGPAGPFRLIVQVENVRAAQGLVAVTLYADDSSRFLARRGALYVGRAPARTPTTRICIHLPGPGTYGLAVYHDADANRTYNRNSLGMPAEGFGFSNNPPTLFGIPSFRRVRLAVPRNNLLTRVRLRYP